MSGATPVLCWNEKNVGLLVFVLGGETVPVVVTIGGGIVLVVAGHVGKRYGRKRNNSSKSTG